ncbi:uncharacterized protein LOC112571711 [Pomacea canaliculata]|uniref:uncharacterized protein LOC112571711 n=1 Tax=Pomacea canaliculata TaxID=400727 RepID=UPI000D738C35|nr:uncharacterized protein LOC112571711 [Pomacea canaliculata]
MARFEAARVGVVVGLAGGAIVLLAVLTLFMCMCCRGHRGPTLPPQSPQFVLPPAIATVYIADEPLYNRSPFSAPRESYEAPPSYDEVAHTATFVNPSFRLDSD